MMGDEQRTPSERRAEEIIIFGNDSSSRSQGTHSFASREEFQDESQIAEFKHRPTMQAPSSGIRPNQDDLARQRSLVDIHLDQSNRGFRGFESTRATSQRQDAYFGSSLRCFGIFVVVVMILLFMGRTDDGSVEDLGYVEDQTNPPAADWDFVAGIEPSDNPRLDAIRGIVLENELSSSKSLNDETSDVYRAALWLASDDPLQLEADNSTEHASHDHDILLERFALVTFYFSMYPELAKSESALDANVLEKNAWLKGSSFCAWEGVFCHDGSVSVRRIVMPKMSLHGTIPSELAALTHLHEILLSTNQISGTIPAILGTLKYLKFLVLYNNFLTGTIPTEIGAINDLQHILLGTNQLTGTIPTELNLPAGLKEMKLDHNLLTGSIPPLDRLKNLTHFSVQNNDLEGPIPPDIFEHGLLETVHLSSNFLTGTLPLVLDRSTLLETVKMEQNNLKGEVPEVFGRLTNLIELVLTDNGFSGPLPVTVGKCEHLKHLLLDGNEFKGDIPLEWNTLSRLEVLVMKNNKLNGHIPPTIGGMTMLHSLWLDGNELAGVLPTEMGLLTRLKEVHLEKNKFDGNIPAEIGNLTSLEIFNLYSTSLTGEMPQAVCNLFDLGKLTVLGADCEEISCSCCNKCYED